MTQRCAQILNGVVVNVILADPATFAPGDGSTIVASDTAQTGWTYAGGVFTPVAPTAAFQTTGLTFEQFMGLFTAAEQAAIFGSSDPQVRGFCFRAAGSDNLNFTDPRVVGAMQYLAAINLVTSARAAIILTGAPHA